MLDFLLWQRPGHVPIPWVHRMDRAWLRTVLELAL